MAKKRKQFIPTYRLHRPSGQAIVEFKGRRIYLGIHDTPISHEKYERLIAAWLSNGRKTVDSSAEPSIGEVCHGYWKWCSEAYPPKNGRTSSTLLRTKTIIRDLRTLHGLSKASQFRPKDLKALQALWIERNYTRKTVNEYTAIVKRIFRWAVAELDLAVDTYQRLCAVEGLRKGRCTAKESKRVEPVPDAQIEAIRPYVSEQVWAIINLQLLTGARSGELVELRPVDIDTTSQVWMARLSQHKNAHRGQERTLYFGPKGQSILKGFLDRPLDKHIFSPKEAEDVRGSRADTHRRPNQPKNIPKTDRTLGEHYTTGSYRKAVARGCDKAGIPRWTPHRLRHTAATRIRREHGLDAAQVILGHATVEVTQVYAEADAGKARAVAEDYG